MISSIFGKALLWFIVLVGIERTVKASDAGTIDQEIKSQTDLNTSKSGEITFFVRAWELVGVTVFDEDELQALLANYSGKEISFAEIKNIASQIEGHYEKNGFLAQATVPPQDVSSGLVRIEVSEAYLGKIRIEKGSSSLVADDTILSMVGASLKEGELYDSDSLNRGLLLADDLSGVSLTGFLQEGSEPGLVDLNLKTLKEARATAE
ncbi:MAG: POTRA domain-containing protein, partial [Opitutae bacterium]